MNNKEDLVENGGDKGDFITMNSHFIDKKDDLIDIKISLSSSLEFSQEVGATGALDDIRNLELDRVDVKALSLMV